MYPYRQARDILSYDISIQIDHRVLWRLIQKKGIKLIKEGLSDIESFYRDAKPVESKARPYETLVLEVDSAGISSKEGRSNRMEAKLVVIYTGKDLESKNSKVARYSLANKTVF